MKAMIYADGRPPELIPDYSGEQFRPSKEQLNALADLCIALGKRKPAADAAPRPERPWSGRG
jgi:hypothetical protein